MLSCGDGLQVAFAKLQLYRPELHSLGMVSRGSSVLKLIGQVIVWASGLAQGLQTNFWALGHSLQNISTIFHSRALPCPHWLAGCHFGFCAWASPILQVRPPLSKPRLRRGQLPTPPSHLHEQGRRALHPVQLASLGEIGLASALLLVAKSPPDPTLCSEDCGPP